MRSMRPCIITFIFSIVMHQQAHAKFFDSITSWFSSWTSQHEQVIDRQYTCPHIQSLIVKNIHGPLHIETGWSEPKIVLTVKKTASSEQALKAFDLVHQESDNGKKITIHTVQHDPSTYATMEYTLVVPENVHLILETEDGDIMTRDIKGAITANTLRGDIDIYASKGDITATIAQQGSIALYQAEGAINATTEYGNIAIFESQDTVNAKTTNGRIRLYCAKLPKNKEMWLQTKIGTISLYLPSTINADIRAKTERSTVTSQLPITFHDFTTTLDSDAWKKFKREINGIVGSRPDGRIRMYSRDSAIELKKRDEP